MRTTLNVEDDVLAAIKELARFEGCSAGEVLSRLVRPAFLTSAVPDKRSVSGFRPTPVQRDSARRLARLGGTEAQLLAISRRTAPEE